MNWKNAAWRRLAGSPCLKRCRHCPVRKFRLNEATIRRNYYPTTDGREDATSWRCQSVCKTRWNNEVGLDFFDADETLFTFDSFTGLQRIFLITASPLPLKIFRTIRPLKASVDGLSKRRDHFITASARRFESWAERLNVEPGKLNEALLMRWRKSARRCRARFLCLTHSWQRQNRHHHQRL